MTDERVTEDAKPKADCPRCRGTGSISHQYEINGRTAFDYTTCPCRYSPAPDDTGRVR